MVLFSLFYSKIDQLVRGCIFKSKMTRWEEIKARGTYVGPFSKVEGLVGRISE